MSKGSQIIPVRFPADLLADMVKAWEDRNHVTRDREWTLSDWIRQACKDKLKHLERGRKQIKKKLYTCRHCGDRVPFTHVSHVLSPLYGPKEYTCVGCSRVTMP